MGQATSGLQLAAALNMPPWLTPSSKFAFALMCARVNRLTKYNRVAQQQKKLHLGR